MTIHEDWLKKLASFPGNLKLPPPSLAELQLEYLEISPGKKMLARLPFQERFTNPVGLYQGGFLAAAIDEVFGPLSYITHGGPCLTLSLNLTYLKAFTPSMGHCLIEAQVLKETNNFIFMRAEIKGPDGDLLLHAETHVNRIKS
jgi:acyl-coenzyme A thioesterase PaaI-like protein